MDKSVRSKAGWPWRPGYGMDVEGIFVQDRLNVVLYKYCCTYVLARMPACLPGWMFLLNEGNTFVLGSMPC